LSQARIEAAGDGILVALLAHEGPDFHIRLRIGARPRGNDADIQPAQRGVIGLDGQ
jgi:hypothetical protein